MKLAELFEEPLRIKQVKGHEIELYGAPGVDTSVKLDSTGGTDWVIDPTSGEMTPEPSEADETKMAFGLIGQIGNPVSVREQPWPANPTMYIITPDDQLAAMGIQLPSTGHAGLIKSGSLYITDPDNIATRPKKISWKSFRIVIGQDGSIALELERSPAAQAQLARKMQQDGIPLSVGG